MTEKLLPVVESDEGRRIPLPEGVDPERALVLSASQFETFREVCKRKWWFKWALKMPAVEKDYLTFGKALHAILERYLRADDTGRNPDGTQVDLYPPGWDAGLQPAEADLIRKLAEAGIDSGLVRRHAQRQVEYGFLRVMAQHEDWLLFVTGFIDLLAPAIVEDHKTTKSWRYAKSPKKLRETTQMLLYAREEFERDPTLEHVTVRHNVFLKDAEAPATKAVTAQVTRRMVDDRWEELKKNAIEMLSLRRGFTAAEQWQNVPGPDDYAHACTAFGGCPYMLVCGGKEQPHQYRKRVENYLAHQARSKESQMTVAVFARNASAAKAANPAAPAPPVNGTPPAAPAPPAPPATEPAYWVVKDGATVQMLQSVLQVTLNTGAISAETPAMQVGANPPSWSTVGALGFTVQQAAPAPTPPPPAPAPAPAAPVGPAPPWAIANCSSCGGRGFNKKGGPCQICDGLSAANVRSMNYTITVDGDGTVSWSPKASAAPATGQASAPLPAAAPAPVNKPEASTATETEAEGEVEETGGKQRRSGGRPKQSFTLVINCSVMGKDCIDLAQELAKLGAELAAQNGALSYYDMDAFQRRDRIASVAGQVCAEWKGKMVVANGASPDLAAFVVAVRAHASIVIEAAAR